MEGDRTGEHAVEEWKCFGEEGVDMLWDLMQKIYQEEKVPNEWRDNDIMPIYKEKGNIQDCSKYIDIKLMKQ